MDCHNDERFWFNVEKADYRKLENIVEDPKDIVDVLIRLRAKLRYSILYTVG